MRSPIITGNPDFQSCFYRCLATNESSRNSSAATTLIFSLTQDTTKVPSNDSTGQSGQYANELTIIFGVTATVLALGSLIFGYLAWRVYKRPECSSKCEASFAKCMFNIATFSSKYETSIERCMTEVAMLSSKCETSVARCIGEVAKLKEFLGDSADIFVKGLKFEDAPPEVQDAATWKTYFDRQRAIDKNYLEAIDMP